MENLEQKITDHIVQKYNPLAVVIHGSRATGKERTHSDWDYIVFGNEPIEVRWEMLFGTANVQVRAIVLPLDNEHITKYHGYLRENNVKVVYDPTHVMPELIAMATESYKKPVEYTEYEIEKSRILFSSYLDSLKDYMYEQEAFFLKLGEIYTLAIKFWFHILNHTYTKQVYDALPRIEKEDPEYFSLLKILASNASNEEKIDASEGIYKRIWK